MCSSSLPPENFDSPVEIWYNDLGNLVFGIQIPPELLSVGWVTGRAFCPVKFSHQQSPLVLLWETFTAPGGTGVRELTRGLATLPQRWIQEPLVVRDRDGTPQEDPHCFCVCSESALLGDLGVSRSMEPDLLSVLSIYPRIFLRVFIVYRLLVGFLYVWLYSTISSCLLVVLV